MWGGEAKVFCQRLQQSDPGGSGGWRLLEQERHFTGFGVEGGEEEVKRANPDVLLASLNAAKIGNATLKASGELRLGEAKSCPALTNRSANPAMKGREDTRFHLLIAT
jgi:hypothetical protein